VALYTQTLTLTGAAVLGRDIDRKLGYNNNRQSLDKHAHVTRDLGRLPPETLLANSIYVKVNN